MLLAVTVAMSDEGRAQAPPRRIVSLNLCTDQIVIDLVPPERIVAVSHLAADPAVSAIAARARGFRATRGDAEDVLALDPDLILAGTWTTPATVDLLRRLGRRIEIVPLAQDLAGVRAAVRQIATAVGETVRGDAVIAAFDERLAAVAAVNLATGRTPPTALVYQVNGLASGPGSLADAALRAAGLRNLASEIGLGAGGQVALEALVARPPDLLVLAAAPDEYRSVAADNLRHPALVRLARERPSLLVHWRTWLCATPAVADAIEALAAARRHLAEPRR